MAINGVVQITGVSGNVRVGSGIADVTFYVSGPELSATVDLPTGEVVDLENADLSGAWIAEPVEAIRIAATVAVQKVSEAAA